MIIWYTLVHVFTIIQTFADISTPTVHTDLCLLRCKWCRLYWLCNGRRLTVKLTRSLEHMGWGHTNLWGNLQRALGEEWNTCICHAQIYRHTHIRIHTHPTPPPHTCTHATHTQTRDPHMVVGVKKPDGQVVVLHWTHGEGTHQPAGEPMNEPIYRRVKYCRNLCCSQTQTPTHMSTHPYPHIH